MRDACWMALLLLGCGATTVEPPSSGEHVAPATSTVDEATAVPNRASNTPAQEALVIREGHVITPPPDAHDATPLCRMVAAPNLAALGGAVTPDQCAESLRACANALGGADCRLLPPPEPFIEPGA